MTPLINRTWELLNVGAKIMCDSDSEMSADLTVKNLYESHFKQLHKKVSGYMENSEDPLDRHKIAAIIMISAIKADVLKTTRQCDIFTANYVLATEVGLSYMLGVLNDKLEEYQQSKIDSFFFPDALSCQTDYFRIFYRNLYFANNDNEWGLNPLDLAERLFLLEYMTLEHNGIDPAILKEY